MRLRTVVMGACLALVLAASAQARLVSRQLWAETQSAAGVPVGHGRVVMAVFFDPNCPYCHRLYNQLRPLLRKEGFTAVWIPVGILRLSSFGKAAAILMAKNRRKALAVNEAKFKCGRLEGCLGGATPRRATPAVTRALRHNVRLLDELGGTGVPVLMYEKADGSIRAVTGDPPGYILKGWLADIADSGVKAK